MIAIYDNYIETDGDYRMVLRDETDIFAAAQRIGQRWQVSNDKQIIIVNTRSEAIDEMIKLLPPRDSWTTQIPWRLREQP